MKDKSVLARILASAAVLWLWRSYLSRGLVQLELWRHARVPGVYSLDAPHLNFGLFRLVSAASLVALVVRPDLFLPARWASATRTRSLLAALALAGGWAVRLDFRPLEVRYYEVQKRAFVRSMWNVLGAVQVCGQSLGRKYPVRQADCPAVSDVLQTAVSPYRRGGENLPYRAVFLPNASGPLLVLPEGTEPGTIFLAVSRDRARVWGTAAALPVRRLGFYAQDFAVETSTFSDWQRRYDNPRDLPVVVEAAGFPIAGAPGRRF